MYDTDCDEYCTAVHEAGHAVMMFLYRRGVKRITIIPDEESGGSCLNTESFRAIWKRFIEHEATTRDVELIFRSTIAGGLAEELVCGLEFDLSGTDKQKVVAALDSPGCLAIYEAFPESEAVRGFEALRREWADRQIKTTREMLREQIPAIKAIAEKLMEKKIIDGRLAKDIFKEMQPPKKTKRRRKSDDTRVAASS